MAYDELTPGYWLRRGADLWRMNAFNFALAGAIMAIAQVVMIGRPDSFAYGVVLGPLLRVWYVGLVVDIYTGRPIFGGMQGALMRLLNGWGAMLMFEIMVVLGGLLLLVPGLLALTVFFHGVILTQYRGLTGFQAFAMSRLITRGFRMRLLALAAVIFAASMAAVPYLMGVYKPDEGWSQSATVFGVVPYFVYHMALLPIMATAAVCACDLMLRRWEDSAGRRPNLLQ